MCSGTSNQAYLIFRAAGKLQHDATGLIEAIARKETMTIKSDKNELSCAQAKKKWGDRIYVRQADGTTTLTEIEDGGGVWRPIYDSARNWAGYRLTRTSVVLKRRRER